MKRREYHLIVVIKYYSNELQKHTYEKYVVAAPRTLRSLLYEARDYKAGRKIATINIQDDRVVKSITVQGYQDHDQIYNQPLSDTLTKRYLYKQRIKPIFEEFEIV